LKRLIVGLLAALALAPAAAQGQPFPELGRCVSVEKGAGQYVDKGCRRAGEGGKADHGWLPGAIDGGFTASFALPGRVAPYWETQSGAMMACSSGTGAGNHISPWEDRETIVFAGCALTGVPCESAGAAEGEVSTSELALTYAPIGPNPKNWGTIYEPATPGAFFDATCGSRSIEVTGSAIVQTPNNTRETTEWRPVKMSEAKGRQRDQATPVTGEPYRGFTATIDGHEESIGLEAVYQVTNGEAVKIRIGA
jgi:hypothetical protein